MIQVKFVNLKVGKLDNKQKVLNEELRNIKGDVKDVKFTQTNDGMLEKAMILYEEA